MSRNVKESFESNQKNLLMQPQTSICTYTCKHKYAHIYVNVHIPLHIHLAHLYEKEEVKLGSHKVYPSHKRDSEKL